MKNNIFESSLGYLISKERGINKDTKDLGGFTNFGIAYGIHHKLLSEKYGINSTEDLAHISYDKMSSFYLNEIWQPYRIGEIKDEQLAMKAFEFVAATGRPLSVLGGIQALNSMNPSEAMKKINEVQSSIYAKTIERHPEQIHWKAGWDKRTKEIPSAIFYDAKKIFDEIVSGVKLYVAKHTEQSSSVPTSNVNAGSHAETPDLSLNTTNTKLGFFEQASTAKNFVDAVSNLNKVCCVNQSPEQLRVSIHKLIG
jgi:hypothetical protein